MLTKIALLQLFLLLSVCTGYSFAAVAAPKISAAPASVNLGSVKLGGASEQKYVTIRNTGKIDLTITAVSITGVDPDEFGQTNQCGAIPPRGSCLVNVTFTPNLPYTKKTAVLAITSNDPKKPTLNVKLSGQVPPPKISATPASINFGKIAAGTSSSTKTITIKNNGMSDLVISSTTVSGTNADVFSADNKCSAIPNGGSCTFDVTFTPKVANEKVNALLDVSSNDPKKTIIHVQLSGQGSTNAPIANTPIATNAVSMSAAFDGTNYLVGLEYNLNGTANQINTHVGAQLVSSTGAKIGSVIETSQHAIASSIAFDGTNYLMVWEDNEGLSPTQCSFSLRGQFINKAGAVVGTSFIISSGIEFDGINILAYGGGKYLATYTKLTNVDQCENSTNRYIAGRVISPDGTMGSEFRISTGNGAGNTMTFDGTNFFVVWREDSQDYEVRGRFVSPTGTPGAEISINASQANSDNPLAVAFDGTNHMVVWNDEVNTTTEEWDLFGQLVKPDGTLVGSVITVTNEAGQQMATSIAFDGTNYLAVWVDMNNDANRNGICNAGEGSCWDVYGQYINMDGALVGNKVAINTDAGSQLGFVAGYSSGKYFVLVNSDIVFGAGGIIQAGDVSGEFVTPTDTSNTGTVTGTVAYTGFLGTVSASKPVIMMLSPAGNAFDNFAINGTFNQMTKLTDTPTTVTFTNVPAGQYHLVAIFDPGNNGPSDRDPDEIYTPGSEAGSNYHLDPATTFTVTAGQTYSLSPGLTFDDTMRVGD